MENKQLRMPIRQPVEDKYPMGWKQLRELCFSLHPECVRCGKKLTALDAWELHHKEADMYNIDIGDFPPNEWAVLCKECHSKITGNASWEKYHRLLENKRSYLNELPNGIYLIEQTSSKPVITTQNAWIFSEHTVYTDEGQKYQHIMRTMKAESARGAAWHYANACRRDTNKAEAQSTGDYIKLCDGAICGVEICSGETFTKIRYLTVTDAFESNPRLREVWHGLNLE